MNREIKFRIWDKNKKIFLPLEYKYSSDYSTPPAAPLIDISGRLWNWSSQHWGMDNELAKNPEDYIIQQYTGLKDKNEKEIYEGDLVNVNFRRCGKFNCKIVYEGPSFEFYVIPEEELSFPMSIRDIPIEIEIIGNIFENPELLK